MQLVAKFQEIQKSIMPLLSEMTNEPPLIEPQPKLEEARLSRASTGTLTKVTAKDGKARSPVKRPLQPIPKEKVQETHNKTFSNATY